MKLEDEYDILKQSLHSEIELLIKQEEYIYIYIYIYIRDLKEEELEDQLIHISYEFNKKIHSKYREENI